MKRVNLRVDSAGSFDETHVCVQDEFGWIAEVENVVSVRWECHLGAAPVCVIEVLDVPAGFEASGLVRDAPDRRATAEDARAITGDGEVPDIYIS